MYDVRLGEDMHVLVGCGLGGGSLVNAGVALRPDDRVFADEVWPGPDRAGRPARGRVPPSATLAQPAERSARGRLIRSSKHSRPPEAGSGRAPIAPPVTVAFDAAVNRAGVAQPACTRCGDCCGGCNVGAKTSVALTYLADAARHGAELFTRAGVRHVSKGADGSWTVHVRRLDKNGVNACRE